jgi:hypothetical protein
VPAIRLYLTGLPEMRLTSSRVRQDFNHWLAPLDEYRAAVGHRLGRNIDPGGIDCNASGRGATRLGDRPHLVVRLAISKHSGDRARRSEIPDKPGYLSRVETALFCVLPFDMNGRKGG